MKKSALRTLLTALLVGAWCAPGWAQWTDITWTNPSNVIVSGPDLTKTGGSAWDGNATASETVATSTDGGARFTVDAADANMMLGLTDDPGQTGFAHLDFAVMQNLDNFKAYELGSQVYDGGDGSVQAGDLLSVERIGTTVYYKRNGSVQYTSAVSGGTGAWSIDAALNTDGKTMLDGQAEDLSDTTPPVWHSNGTYTAGAQSASAGSGAGEIDVVLQPAGNNCDQLGGDGAQACRTDNIAVAALRVWYAEDDGDQSCSAEVDRATDPSQDFSSSPLTSTSETLAGLTEGQGYCLEAALVDGSSNDSTAGTVEVYAESGTSDPVWQDAGSDSDIRIATPDQPYGLLVRLDIAVDAYTSPTRYALHWNTSASDAGSTRFPATGYIAEQRVADTDSDGVEEIAVWLPVAAPLSTIYVAVEACDSAPTPTCTTASLEGADVASATTLVAAFMNEGDVGANQLTVRWTNGTGFPVTVYRKNFASDCSPSDYSTSEDVPDGDFESTYTSLNSDQDYCFIVAPCTDGGCTGHGAASRKVVARPTSMGAIIKTSEGLVTAQPWQFDFNNFGASADFLATGFYAPGEDMNPFSGGIRIYGTRATSSLSGIGYAYVEHNGGGDDYYRWNFGGSTYVAFYRVADGTPTQIGANMTCASGDDWYFAYVAGSGATLGCNGDTRSNSTLTGAVTGFMPATPGRYADAMRTFGPSPDISMAGMPSGSYLLRCDLDETLVASAAESGGTATMTLPDTTGGWYPGWLKVSTQSSNCTTGILGEVASFQVTMGSAYEFSPSANKHALLGPALRDVQPDSIKVAVSAEQPYDVQIEVARQADGFPGLLIRGPPGDQMGNSDNPLHTAVMEMAEGLVPSGAYQYRVVINGEPGATYTFPTHPADGTEGKCLVLAGSCLASSHVPYKTLAAMGTRINAFRASEGPTAPIVKVLNGDVVYENPGIIAVACWADKTSPACPREVDILYWDALGAPNTREWMHGDGPTWIVVDDHDGGRNDATGANHHAWVDPVTGLSDGSDEYTLNAVEIAAFDAGRDQYQRAGNPDPFDPAEPGFFADVVGRVLILGTDLISYRDDLNAANQLVTETAGTVSINTGSAALTGSGTDFTLADVGDPVRIGADGECIYTLATITDGTNATITPNYGDCGESNAGGANFVIWRQYDVDNSGSKTTLGAAQLSAVTRAVKQAVDAGTVDRVVWISSKSLFLGQDHPDSWESDTAGKPGYTAERDMLLGWFAANSLLPAVVTGDNHNRGFDLQAQAHEYLTVGPGPSGIDAFQTDPPTHGYGSRSPDFLVLEIDTDPGGVCDKGDLTNGVCIKPEAVGIDGVGLLVNGFLASASDSNRYAHPQRSQRLTALAGGVLAGRRGEDSVTVSDGSGVFDRFDPAVGVGEDPYTYGATSGVGSDGGSVVAVGQFIGNGTFGSNVRRYDVTGQTLVFDTSISLTTSGWARVLSPTVASDDVVWAVREAYYTSDTFHHLHVFREGTGINIDDGEADRKYPSIAAVADWIAFAYLHDATGEVYFRYCGPTASCEGTNPNDEATGQFASGATGVDATPAVCSSGSDAIMVYQNAADGLGVVRMDGSKTRGSAYTVESAVEPRQPTCAYVTGAAAWFAGFERDGIIYVWRAEDPETNDWELWSTIETDIAGAINCGADCIVEMPQDQPVSGTNLPIQINFRPDHGGVVSYWDAVVVNLDATQASGHFRILELLGVL